MNVYQKVIEHYGKTEQKIKAIEELRELEKELWREMEKSDYDIYNMINEIADVANMLVQLCWIYRIDQDTLRQGMEFKMERTLKRIEEELK